MRRNYLITVTGRQSQRKPKKAAAKNIPPVSIAQQYWELRRLRELISEAESRRTAR
jgi:hypothetical protein